MIKILLSVWLLLQVGVPAYAVDIDQYPALAKLVDDLAASDEYPRQELIRVLQGARVDQRTIELMNKQYEALPWHRYREIFINDDRINRGVEFWAENLDTLQAAEKQFGVSQAVIVALIGVETHYGTRMGDRRVLDSLVTLTADFPRRSDFFGKELRTFLITTRRENIAPDSVMGSYAGAIGIPQFMPTSYEAYSVDFNGNGRRDLVNEIEDAIGSVANYLAVHGWERDQAIYANLSASLPDAAMAKVTRRATPKLATSDLVAGGVKFDQTGASDKAALLALTEPTGKRYFVGFRNFYAITRYNPSTNYAMAVTELSEIISARYSG